MERVAPPPPDPLESADILARDPDAGPVFVQFVVIMRECRACKAGRSKTEVDQVAKEVLAKAVAGADMTALVKQYSDAGHASYGASVVEVSEDMPEIDMKKLALRLRVGEAGLVSANFGWWMVKRVPPPPPDPLESSDILKRAQVTEHAKVKHILLGWTEVHAKDERGKNRDRKTLDKLVKATVAKLKKGEKIEPLMKELSEDPGSAETGGSYDVTSDSKFVAPFLKVSLRLHVQEVGVVKTEYGIHIVQRVE
jgi:hypothetical protein